TTLCYHLAYLFTTKNFKTLLIDIDPQGNLTSCYFPSSTDTSSRVKLLFENEIPIPLKINENLYIVTSSIELSKYELQVKLESYFKLKAYLDLPEIKKNWNVILIDTPPVLNIFTSNAFIAP
ncbi:MAG: AAA family ATPase, partial [Sulfolobales archaeon]